jgi:hypothetical protein
MMVTHEHEELPESLLAGSITRCSCGQEWKAYTSPYGQIHWEAILSDELQERLEKVFASCDAAVTALRRERKAAKRRFEEAERLLYQSRRNQEYEIYAEAGVKPPMLYA